MMSLRPCVFPVIDVLDRAQAVRSAELAFSLGADGIIFDDSDEDGGVLHAIVKELRGAWPDKLLGAGYSTLGPLAALQRSLLYRFDATWTARRDVTSQAASADAVQASSILRSNPEHSLFVSIATPDRPEDPRPGVAAVRAHELGMIPTARAEASQGPCRKLSAIRSAIGDSPLALAGCGPNSFGSLTTLPSHVFVSTAGETGFQYLDPNLLRTCMCRVAAAAATLTARGRPVRQ